MGAVLLEVGGEVAGAEDKWPPMNSAHEAYAVLLKEVAVALRPPILRRYLALAPGARPHIPVDRHAPLEEFQAIAAQIPVFRITSGPG